MLVNHKLIMGSKNLPNENVYFSSFITECFALRKNCSVSLLLDVARIIFYRPAIEAF